jgi:hypothetical protein
LVVDDPGVFGRIGKLVFVVEQGFDQFVKTVLLSEEKAFEFFLGKEPVAELPVVSVGQLDEQLEFSQLLGVNVGLLD